jgi:ATP-binding cassette subfamily B protein
MKRSDLWRKIGYVPQKAFLFSGSIADNLRFGDETADDAALWQALEIAQGREFVADMAEGLGAPVSQGGTNVSGGQRQRLAIARAFLKDAPVLILDEAMASLDARSDALIRDALARLTTGRTVLVIAHRLELTYTADQVVVLDAGRAVETGTYESLLAQGGLYRQLVESYANGER